ncbi:DNA/RNA non-specific endonuclease [Deinococcus proteolyticus MRP]|uniref:Endonuclease n=1 Tax=Deinococcus proteolyticus (strain ATCC 35074 / DSM 20540 / JCM 6276 / NBRC 101906 / NCIMB 13154 / VKM Ac-1939 / CCM 2703 / MRP) TaxID=693977 RepID=F0RJL9_DEIPM|nr:MULTISPECIES: DNA/RNA non-specific endonuclease [Deinococcus]ADY26589.1 DNA/RNA non-specific endonuclease [Deinococcus proteolyticus MRP]MCY1702713.1 DNA/RNA non-specific endonuclease [Deinococcus sp. SL84]
MTRKRQAGLNQATLSLLGLLLAGAAALWGCGEDLNLPNLPTPPGESVPGAYGDAGQCRDEWRGGIPTLTGNQTRLLCRQEYAALYDPQHRVPRVVGEYLAPTEFSGDVQRQDDFAPDPDLPAGESAELNDYRRSGYDRGHMAPAADFKSSPQAMRESFYLSNMVPQNHDMNTGVWAALESAVRACAKDRGGVFVLTGPVLGKKPATIGGGVAVPDALFKVIVSGKDARAFVIPNKDQASDTNFGRYEVTPQMVEGLTGLTLFPDGSVTLDQQGRFCRGSFGG